MVSISSEKLRTGISEILHRLHEGNTLDEVICDISDGAYENTSEFTKRFIKGTFDENAQDYIGDPESLSFCAGYINYMIYERSGCLGSEHPSCRIFADG